MNVQTMGVNYYFLILLFMNCLISSNSFAKVFDESFFNSSNYYKNLCNSIYKKRANKAAAIGISYSSSTDPYVFNCLDGYWGFFDIQQHAYKNDIKTWAEFTNTVNDMKEKRLPMLAEKWPYLSDDMLSIIYYTGVVGHLFPVGGVMMSDKKVYEIRSVRKWYTKLGKNTHNLVPVEAYTRAPAGECNDFATVLYMLLKENGYDAYHVGPPGHIHVQVNLEEKKLAIDSTFLFVADVSLEDIFDNSMINKNFYKKQIYVIPNGGYHYKSRHFRRRRLDRNLDYFAKFGYKKLISKDYSHWDKYEIFKRDNGIYTNPFFLSGPNSTVILDVKPNTNSIWPD